jgi:hypothetical protein
MAAMSMTAAVTILFGVSNLAAKLGDAAEFIRL